MYASRRRKRSTRSVLRFFIASLVLIIMMIGGKYAVAALYPRTLHSPIPLITSAPRQPSPTLTPLPQSASLGSVVQQALTGTQGTYGIVVHNLDTGEGFTQNEHHVFQSASLYKLWVMAVVEQQLAAGTLHASDVLSDSVEDLNTLFNIDPADAEQTTGTITYSVQDALYQMITISDNYAALLLTKQVTLSSVAAFLSQEGFHESAVSGTGADPTTTASDVALFFEKLYRGELGNAQSTQDMLALLEQQKLNEKMPSELPDGIDIAHKTGEKDDVSHDAGIVYIPNNTTVLVILSQSNDPAAANGRIGDIALAVYQYFTKQS